MWRKKYGEEPPFSIAAQIFDEVMLWAESVKKVGDVRKFDLIIKSILESSYDGITGTFKFNKDHYVPASDNTIPAHLLQVQDSRTQQVMIGTSKQADFQVPPWIK